MAISGIATMGAGSAGLVIHASGTGFGIFSSFSAFLAESAHYSPSSFVTTGKESLDLDSKYGDLIFSGADTISVIDGHVSYSVTGGVTFSIGNDTVPMMASTVDGSAANQLSALKEINAFFSAEAAKETFGGAGSFSAAHLIAATAVPTVAGAISIAAPSTETLSDKSTITVVKLDKNT